MIANPVSQVVRESNQNMQTLPCRKILSLYYASAALLDTQRTQLILGPKPARPTEDQWRLLLYLHYLYVSD